MSFQNNLTRKESTSSRSSTRSAGRKLKSPSPVLDPLIPGRQTPIRGTTNDQKGQALNSSILSNSSRRSNQPKISPKIPDRNQSLLSNGSKRSTSSSSRNGRPSKNGVQISDIEIKVENENSEEQPQQSKSSPDRFEVILEQQTETETEDDTDFDQEEQEEEERNEQVEILTKLISNRIDHTATQETNAVIYIIDALKLFKESQALSSRKSFENLGCVLFKDIIISLMFYIQLGLHIWLGIILLLGQEEMNLTDFLVIICLVFFPSFVLILLDMITLIRNCSSKDAKSILIDIAYLPVYIVKIDLFISLIQKILYDKQIRRVTKRKFRKPLQVKLDGLETTIQKTLFLHTAFMSAPLAIYLSYLLVQRIFVPENEIQSSNELEKILLIICIILDFISISYMSMVYSTQYVNEFKTASSLLHRNLNDYKLAGCYVKLLRFLSNGKLLLIRIVPFVLYANYWPWLLLIVFPGHFALYYIFNLIMALTCRHPILSSAHNSSPCSHQSSKRPSLVLNAMISLIKTFTFYETFDILSIHYIFYHCFLFAQALIIFIFYFLKGDTFETKEIKIYLSIGLSFLFASSILLEIALKFHLSAQKERIVVSKLLLILKNACIPPIKELELDNQLARTT